MKAICEICNVEFTHWRYDRIPRFCSKECRIKSKVRFIKCLECEKEFKVPQGQELRKFCSTICSNRFNQKPDPTKHFIFTCQWCGKEFEDWTYRQPRYCSIQCVSEFAARQPKPKARRPDSFITKICEICGKEYTVHKGQDTRKNNVIARFCSKKCQRKSLSINMRGIANVNYVNGKSDPRGPDWCSKKRAALKRDNFTCQICGAKRINGRLPDVHHIIQYQDFNGDFERSNDLSNLITLCRKCHGGVESGKLSLPASNNCSNLF